MIERFIYRFKNIIFTESVFVNIYLHYEEKSLIFNMDIKPDAL